MTPNDLLPKEFRKQSRPISSSGFPRFRSKSHNECQNVSSLIFRVIVIGSKGVGKTSLINRYLSDTFSDLYRPTVSDIYEKTVMRQGGDVVNLFKIYDTAGDLQYEFPVMFNLTVAEGDMFVFVYSVENRKSFENVKAVWEHVLQLKDKEKGKLPMVLVANKADVSATRRKVSESDGIKLGEEMDCPFLEISAKTAFMVDCVYSKLLDEREKIEKPHNQSEDVIQGHSDVSDSPISDLKPPPVRKRLSLKGKQNSCALM